MNISKFKKEITICSIAVAVAINIISLPFIGLNLLFSYGLAIGTVVAILNTYLLTRAVEKAVKMNKRKYIVISFSFRMVVYGGAFVLSIKTANISALGTAIGFFLPQISMYIITGLLPKIRKWRGLEEETRYETDETKRVFIKKPWISLYHNGRTYKTHQRFRVVKRVKIGETKKGQ